MPSPEENPERITVSEELRDIVVDHLPKQALAASDTLTVVYKPIVGNRRGRLQLDYEPMANLVNGKLVEVLSSNVLGGELGSPWIHYAHCRDFGVELDSGEVYYHEHAAVMDDELEKIIDEDTVPMTPERIKEIRETLARFAVGELEVTSFEAGFYESRAGANLDRLKLDNLLAVFTAI